MELPLADMFRKREIEIEVSLDDMKSLFTQFHILS